MEVTFQENISATTGMEGGAPLWKQSLSLPFRAPQDDYTPDSLAQVHKLHLFLLVPFFCGFFVCVFCAFFCVFYFHFYFFIIIINDH